MIYYDLLNNERKLAVVNVEAYRNTLYVIAVLLGITWFGHAY